MAYYPVNLDLDNRKCVVIGGGSVAERKVETLLDFGAQVFIVAPDLTPRLQALAVDGLVLHSAGVYFPGVLEGAFLAIAATDDREVNESVSLEARRLGVLVNVVDDPELCTFFMPAVVRRGDLVMSVSTSGKSPAFARRIREELESRFGPEYADLVDMLGTLREAVKQAYSDPEARYNAFMRILDSDAPALLAEGRRDEAIERARKCI